jgi:hypothetical protein
MRVQGSSYRPAGSEKIGYRGANEPRCHYAIGPGCSESSARHSIYDGARAILDDCTSAGLAYGAKAFRSIATHSGENHADDVLAKCARSTCEQRIG